MKLKSIKRIKLEQPVSVCDLSVDKYNNFALSNGVVVHNSVSLARNPYNQEVLKCRGKGLNILKATLSKAISNQEISSFLVALGADIKSLKEEGKITKFRVGKIFLFSDPDVDAPLIGNTKIMTRDGSNPTIEELANTWEIERKPFWVLSRYNDLTVSLALAYSPKIRARVNTYYKITLSDGSYVECTDTHQWCISSFEDSYIQTQDLKEGDNIVSLTGYLSIKKIEKIYSDNLINFYCLTVPSTGNFFVKTANSGILSSNCHIDALWLTWIYTFAPDALKEGMVYKINIPLYQASWRDKGEDRREYGFSLKEIQKKIPKSAHITRVKGLGELTAKQLEPFINIDSRNITRISFPEAEKRVEEFLEIMGDSVETRKKILGIKERIISK